MEENTLIFVIGSHFEYLAAILNSYSAMIVVAGNVFEKIQKYLSNDDKEYSYPFLYIF